MVLLIWESFSFRVLPAPKIPGINCVGLAWKFKRERERVVIWLVYCLPYVPPETLLLLLYVVSGWALEYLNLIVRGDFNIHADDSASSQAVNLMSSMTALGLS